LKLFKASLGVKKFIF